MYSRLTEEEIKQDYEVYRDSSKYVNENSVKQETRDGLSKSEFENFANEALEYFQIREVEAWMIELTSEEPGLHTRAVPLFRRLYIDAVFARVSNQSKHTCVDRHKLSRMLDTTGTILEPAAVHQSMKSLVRVQEGCEITHAIFKNWLLRLTDSMPDWEFREGLRSLLSNGPSEEN